MAYSKYGKIEAKDYNDDLKGLATSSTSTNINTVWSTGNGKNGYGQTAVANVAVAAKVLASDWTIDFS